MGNRLASNVFAVAGAFLILGALAGCAGLEYAPKRTVLFHHKELPAADRAVEAARKAGKHKECPEEFQAAEKMKDEAYEIYWSCRTKEGIAKANEAAGLANGLCPKKAEPPKPMPVVEPPPPPPPAPAPPAPPPPPPPAPAPPAAPSVSLSANPPAIDAGKCTTLFWSSENASGATIDQGVGGVEKSGSRQVCPAASTLYTITATGEGGSRTARTMVTVNPPPPPPAKVVDRLVVHVNFDSDKAVLRKVDTAELRRAIDFVKKYPGHNISVEGHTDNVGKDRYNQALSERRAAAVKKYLVDNGATNADKIKPVGYGKTRPVADNSTAEGKFKNRRVEILILSE